MQPLPIDPLLGEITSTLAGARAVVLEAPPGAGKTTRVPAALLSAELVSDRSIVVAEPRRLAARLAARRVADERGERVGETVGYSVRFESVASRKTRIHYVTEGVLVRRLLDDPKLDRVGAVVLDEFHERHVATDLCLSLVERLRRGPRPDLLLVVMSATLEAEPVARFLGCPRIRSEGRSHPVAIEHLDRPDDRPLDKQVVSAVRRIVQEQPEGDVLVFLPGAAEIRRALSALEPLAESADLSVLPLHGDLSIDEQTRAIEPSRRRKVVLSTNVAESSVTIPGVTAVVDSGLARIASHSPWTGFDRLVVGAISRASAAQRAGRAGRTAPGRVLRLYTRGDHDRRREHDAPEVTRLDLSEPLLTLHGSGVGRASELSWLDPPPAAALSAAETLLGRLGALNADGALTPIGRRMLELPLHPRLGRLVAEAERSGVARRAALVAALLSERDIRARVRTGFGESSSASYERGPSDVLALIDLFDEAALERFAPRAVRAIGLDPGAVRAVERATQQLERLVRNVAPELDDQKAEEQALQKALLAAFPDRVARRPRPGARELVLCTGGSARLAETSVVIDAPLLVAIDVEDRAAGRSSATLVRLASAIEPEWLLDASGDLFSESDELVWNAEAERVERVTRLAYGSVLLEESRTPAPASRDAASVLCRAAASAARRLFGDTGLSALFARLALLREHLPEAQIPDPGPDPIESAVITACANKTSFAELRAVDLSADYVANLPPSAQRLLREHAPERVSLPGGRSVPVVYELGKPPWMASRLQDFFGMQSGPSVCKGRVPIVLHLLAPNQRAVQVTTDLSGFWERHYPSIRRELMRRYPKHAWPEDGRTASPPPPRARR